MTYYYLLNIGATLDEYVVNPPMVGSFLHFSECCKSHIHDYS